MFFEIFSSEIPNPLKINGFSVKKKFLDGRKTKQKRKKSEQLPRAFSVKALVVPISPRRLFDELL
jgi:hypothetical protein